MAMDTFPISTASEQGACISVSAHFLKSKKEYLIVSYKFLLRAIAFIDAFKIHSLFIFGISDGSQHGASVAKYISDNRMRTKAIKAIQINLKL